jgi:hypothetical protein
MDDFLPECSNVQYPLLRALHSEFKEAYKQGDKQGDKKRPSDVAFPTPIKEISNEPVFNFIALEKKAAQNLTCIRLSQFVPVKWIKADANELTARLNSLDCDWRSRDGEPHRCFGD